MILRPYQRAAVDSLFGYFARNDGCPLLVLPTASGKSIIQAAFIREAIAQFPATRFLLLSHVKELLQQNADKLGMPYGMYSAGLGRRETDQQVTIAGIQSAWRKAGEFGRVDLVIIDESHLLSKRQEGMYPKFLADLRTLNPKVKIIGMTATPYRLGSGMLHQGKGAIFTDIAYDADINELIDDGYLCKLTSKIAASPDLAGVNKVAGDYNRKQLENRMAPLVQGTVADIIKRTQERNKLLVFCCGVDHAHAVRDEIRAQGRTAECITGETPNREEILADFAAGRYWALTNCNVLTTGFDQPDIDTLAMLRPTKSCGLYVQMVGRGMRLHPSKTETLVLDYAGNILEHGPIDGVKVNRGSGEVETQKVKKCPGCQSPVKIGEQQCVDCSYEWPPPPPRKEPTHNRTASDAAILGGRKITQEYIVDNVFYRRHSKQGSPDSLRVDYVCGNKRFSEWVCLEHSGYPRSKAEQWWTARTYRSAPMSIAAALGETKHLDQPIALLVKTIGKYPEIIKMTF